jgi:small-conductance mechanosensitive channel
MWVAGFGIVLIFAIYTVTSRNTLYQFSTTDLVPTVNSDIDQSRYATARNLAALAATPQEQQLAIAAMRAADHELDQSFATAIRHAGIDRQKLSDPALEVSQSIAALKKAIQSDEFTINSLQNAGPAAIQSVQDPDSVDVDGQKLRLAEAQLALDNDELDNAQEELGRLGGNRQSDIQHAFDQHRAIEPQAASLPKSTATAALENPKTLRTLVGKTRVYRSLLQRQAALARARNDVATALASVTQQRNTLKMEAPPSSAPQPPSPSLTNRRQRSLQIADLEERSNHQKDISDLDRRIRDLGTLQTVYSDWRTAVSKQREAVATNIIGDLLSIVMCLLGVFLLSGVIQHFIYRWEVRSHTLFTHTRVLVALALQILVFAKILTIIFGLPEQSTTLFGLITAGVTIALKDFLLSIFGWFGLMGRKGIRVGDWVEIDGTQGEVIEITVLRTTLLETGNWATAGHPTGRQAVFMNKFPFEHKYFNFTTEEQWMWDQLSIAVSPGKEITREILAQIQQLVDDETREDALHAEQAWTRLIRLHGLTDFGTTPPVVLRSTPSGSELVVRYIVKAQNRFEFSVRLRDGILAILGTIIEPGTAPFVSPTASSTGHVTVDRDSPATPELEPPLLRNRK